MMEKSSIHRCQMDTRKQMEFIHKLYAEGLLDNQTFTQDNTQFTSLLDNEGANLVAVHAGGAPQVDGTHFWSNTEGPWQDWASVRVR